MNVLRPCNTQTGARADSDADSAVESVSACGGIGDGESSHAFGGGRVDWSEGEGAAAAAMGQRSDLGAVNSGGVAASDAVAAVSRIARDIDGSGYIARHSQVGGPTEGDSR